MKKFFVYNGFSNIMPELIVWMIYLKLFGWSTKEIALLEGTFTFCTAVFEVPSGVIADRIGKKRALQIGELICILYLLSYFFPRIHIIVYTGFICFSVGLSLISGTDTSLLYNLTEDSRFMKYMGYFNSVAIFSVAFGNVIGGWLANFSWSLLFITSILCRLISLYCITTIDEPTSDVNTNATLKLHMKELFVFIRKNKKFQYLFISLACLLSSITLSYQYIPMILHELNVKTGPISTMFGAVSFLGATLALFSDRLSNKLSLKIISGTIFTITVISFLCLGCFSSSSVIVSISFMLPNILFELLDVIIDSQVHNELIDSIRVSSVSLINLINSLLLTLGSILVSIMLTHFKLSSIISIICTMSILVSIVAYMKYYGYKKGNKTDE